MKRFCIMVFYWILAVFLFAAILLSLEYSFGDSLFIGVMLLPGCLAARYFVPKIRHKERFVRILNTVCVLGAILLVDILFVIWYHLFRQDSLYFSRVDDLSPIMLNPVFVALIMAVIAYCDYILDRWLMKRFADEDKDITFTSDYRKVTLTKEEMMYIESRDTEVWIYATGGRIFRNKTPITQWQNILEDRFIRIHRSYLVNKAFITSHDNETVTVDSAVLPLSRKNRKTILAQL